MRNIGDSENDMRECYLFITIDTEDDEWSDYTIKRPSVKNIEMLPVIQDIFDKYAAIPTYLINYPVATNENSIQLLKKYFNQGKCDIGTHCHPWNTPPFQEVPNDFNSFMCNLPGGLIEEKMNNLHQEIIKNFDLHPVCFRAGRWGLGAEIAKIMRGLNYKIDTSMTPFCDWTEYNGPIFKLLHNDAFGFNEKGNLCPKAYNCRYCKMLSTCILQVPPTIGFLQSSFHLCNRLHTMLQGEPHSKLHLLGLFDKLRILNYRWLSPETTNSADMISLSKIMIQKGCRFLNMFFHSTSLSPGKSPFVRDKAELQIFLSRIEEYLKFILAENIICIKLSEARKVLK